MNKEIHIPDDEKITLYIGEDAVEATWEELTDGKGDEDE